MAASNEMKVDSRVTGICVLSFPALFQPRAKILKPGESPRDAKYEAVLIAVPEQGAQEWLRLFKADALALLVSKHGNDTAMIQAKIAANEIHWPFKPVTDQIGYPAGGTIIRASSKYKPDTVSRYAEPGTSKPATITDPDKFYPGCWVRASIRPYLFGYNTNLGKRGVTFNLNNIQLCDDMPAQPRLDNRKSGEDEFEAVAAPTFDVPNPVTPGSAGNALLD